MVTCGLFVSFILIIENLFFLVFSVHKTFFYVTVREFEFLSHCIVEPGFAFSRTVIFLVHNPWMFLWKKNPFSKYITHIAVFKIFYLLYHPINFIDFLVKLSVVYFVIMLYFSFKYDWHWVPRGKQYRQQLNRDQQLV